MPAFNPLLSTDANLAAFGFEHVRLPGYRHDVVDARGVVVFTGTAHEVNDWLRRGAPVDSIAAAELVAAFAAGATDAEADAAAHYVLSLPATERAKVLDAVEEAGNVLDRLALLARMELCAGRPLRNDGTP